MRAELNPTAAPGLLARVAAYGDAYRRASPPLLPSASTDELRRAFCGPLQSEPTSADDVIAQLIAAAEPGLVGNTDPNFFAWVMGSSNMVGVSADVLTSIWGQNAAIFQTSPAAAVAEEAVSSWLLELLDLPRESSVGLVTGATMATFVGLAAARSEVLRRAGHDFEANGLQGAPIVRVYLSDDAHVANHSALRFLGFGENNLVPIRSDRKGLMSADQLKAELAKTSGPKIIIGQAGHINSGGFEDFEQLSALSQAHDAWLHIDGAFGLWARMLPEKQALTKGLELADSWSVDGHKWVQIPYDSGFAIVRHPDAHRRAMSTTAGYLNSDPADGRNPSDFNPELSRRARGFAAWAVFKSLGRSALRDMIARHCRVAEKVARLLKDIPGLSVDLHPDLNQVIIRASSRTASSAEQLIKLAERVTAHGPSFVKSAVWKGETVLRISVIANSTDDAHAEILASAIGSAWTEVQNSQN